MKSIRVTILHLVAVVLVVLAAVPAHSGDDMAPYRLVDGLYGAVSQQPDREFRVVVQLRSPDYLPEIVSFVDTRSGRVEATVGARLQLRGSGRLLWELAGRQGVVFIRPVKRLKVNGLPGNNLSVPPVPGLSDLHALGITGEGVKIGIVDGGFYGYSRLLGSELPSSVHVKSFRHDGCGVDVCSQEDHGTAVAEVVRQIAPGAELYLASVETDLELQQAVQWFVEQGVHVVNGSIGFLGCGPRDGRGECARSVAVLRSKGILPVFAAGNDGMNHWMGVVADRNGDGLMEVNGSAEFIYFMVIQNDTVEVVVNWDDWGPDPSFPASDQDVDVVLYAVDLSSGTFRKVADSISEQAGFPGEEPLERMEIDAIPGELYVMVLEDYSTTRDLLVDVTIHGDWVDSMWPEIPAGSIVSPADAPEVVAVGAVTSKGILHPYSSQGPLWNGYIKPDVVAPSGLSTSTFGARGFYGTSASSPVVAGLAGLVRQMHPDWGPDAIQAALELWALDVGAAGQDPATGMGLISMATAPRYLSSALPPAGMLLFQGEGPQGVALGYHGSTFLAGLSTFLPEDQGGEPVWYAAKGQAVGGMAGPAALVLFHGPQEGGNLTSTVVGRFVVMSDDAGGVVVEGRDLLNREFIRWQVADTDPQGDPQWWAEEAGAPLFLFTERSMGSLGVYLYSFDENGEPRWQSVLASPQDDGWYPMTRWRRVVGQDGAVQYSPEVTGAVHLQISNGSVEGDFSPFFVGGAVTMVPAQY